MAVCSNKGLGEEEMFTPEAAVVLREESDSAGLVERLLQARRRAISAKCDSYSSEEESRQIGRSRSGDGEDKMRDYCEDHSNPLEYWCQDDCMLVCKDCLIIGEHRAHNAVKEEQRRSAADEDRLCKLLPSLQVELEMSMEVGRQIESEGSVELSKVKAVVESWLDEAFLQEKGKMVSLLSAYTSLLQDTIFSIQSDLTGLSSQVTNPDTVASMLADPVRLCMLPSTMLRQDTKLVLSKPLFRLTGVDGRMSSSDTDSSMCTQSSPPSSPVQLCSSTSMGSASTAQSSDKTASLARICPLNVAALDGESVTVLKNGTPGQFYCQLSSVNPEELKIIADLSNMTLESRICPPVSGQGVLARWGGRWCRATVLEGGMSGWRCELVDYGQVVVVAALEMADLPPSVLKMPALSVRCTLARAKVRDWSEGAREDWEKLISGQQFTLSVEDHAVSSVHLVQAGVEMVDRLQFLGHLPGGVVTDRLGQHYSHPGDLSSSASLCYDYQQISPDSILLYFHDHLLRHKPQLPDQLDTHPGLVCPPGYVEPGHAVLAPWEGRLYRASVLAVTGATLTVLYVDHGNTDTASWWDCSAVSSDLLFPPLATQVRLGGVRSVGEGGWSREACSRLHQVLSRAGEDLEVVIVGRDEVEIFVRQDMSRLSVGQLMVEEGFARGGGICENLFSALPSSGRSSCGSTGQVMSNFLIGEVKESEQLDMPHSAVVDDSYGDQDTVHMPVMGAKEEETNVCKEENGPENRVYLTGKTSQMHLSEESLVSWAGRLWGRVDTVKIGHNQVVLDFSTRESAELCCRQGQADFESVAMEIYPHILSFYNGVRVTGLPADLRRPDVIEIFSKFGDIAFIQGPFGKLGVIAKVAVVVFRNQEIVEKVLRCRSIKYGDKILLVGRNRRIGLKAKVNNAPGKDEDSEPKVVVDNVLEVEVLHVDSPEQVWVRFAQDKDRWTEFHQDLQEAGETGVGMELDAMLGSGEKVICMVEGAWYRGYVVGEGQVYRVKVVDLGMVVQVESKNVKKLDDPVILRVKLFATSVKLGGIEPAGSGGWSASSGDFISRHVHMKRVFLANKDDKSEDLLVEEVSANNPVDVETVSRVSLSEMLLERGLALKKNTRSKCAKNWIAIDDEVKVGDEFVESTFIKKEKFGMSDGCTPFPISQRLTLSQASTVPANQVFAAMLLHIDCSGVVWLIPKTHWAGLSEMVAELASCSDPVEEAIAGMLVVGRLRGRNVRGRVLEGEEVVRLVDIDSGEVFSSLPQNLYQVCPSLLCRPPLAIPVKLYGVKKITSALCKAAREAVISNLKEKSASRFIVSVMEKNLTSFPLPGTVRYTMKEMQDGNLALDLVEMGLCEVITNYSQWDKEMSDHGLEWMVDPMVEPPMLCYLPHPLPLVVGQCASITVEGLAPGVGGRVGVQFWGLLDTECGAAFQQRQLETSAAPGRTLQQVEKLITGFSKDRVSLAISASTAELVPSPSVGQDVLVYFVLEEGGEWCRGKVEALVSKEVVTVYYTDYGHRGQVDCRHLRRLSYQDRMKPVQLREVVLRMPDSDGEVKEVRRILEEVNQTGEKLMMRIEKIMAMDSLEEIMVSLWRVVAGDTTLSSQLQKIC